MSKYKELITNPPKIVVDIDSPREVIFYLISCMCDNKYKITFNKKENGEYSVSAGRFALSNFQMKDDYETDLRWFAEDNEWDKVVSVINSGTSVVESVRYR